MGILLILSAVLFLLIAFARAPRARVPCFAIGLAVFCWLLCEAAAYGLILHQIQRGDGDNFLIMGRQKILDTLMKQKIYDALFQQRHTRRFPYTVDDTLGYTVTANYFTEGIRQTNHAGLRGDRDYPLLPPADNLRVAAFGDSFFFGDGEMAQDAWPHILEKSVNHLDVLNFGVSGYGLGQIYLRYLKDGLAYHPDILVLNYVLLGERDHFRAAELLSAKRKITDSALFRVKFEMNDGVLISHAMTPADLFDTRVREEEIFRPYGLSEKDGLLGSRWFSYSNVGLLIRKSLLKIMIRKKMTPAAPEELSLNVYILDQLLQIAQREGTHVIFYIRAPLEDLPPPIRQVLYKYRDSSTYLNAKFLMPAMVAEYHENFDNLMNETGHFNRKGNEIVAAILAHVLKSREWGSSTRQFRFDERSGFFLPTR